MPRELSSSEEAAWNRYQTFGTPDEIQSQIRKLRKEAATYRTRAGELEEAAKSAATVPEGGKVLTKDEAAAFEAFTALQMKPEDVQATITERDKLKDDLAKKDRETAREAAAKALGIEGKDLASFAGADDLTYEVREQEVERNGKKEMAQVAYVKDAEGKEHPLADYGKEKWGRPFEVLTTASTDGTKTGNRYTTETGTGSKGSEAVKGGVDDAIQKNHERARAPNPLRPATTT